MDCKDCRIVFLGTPALAAEGLETLLAHGFNIVGVVSQPDAAKGRERTPTPSPVSRVALAHQIPLHRPEKLNRDYGFVADLHPDLLLTYAFGQILSTRVLALSSSLPPVNIHASDLPRLRGASPIQTALLNGDESTAVCLMEMVKQMDAGRVFARRKVAMAPEDDCTSLTAKISRAAAELIVEDLPAYIAGELAGEPQDESQVTFCHMFQRRDEYLDPSLTPAQFIGRVRAFSEKPGAFLRLENGLQLKVYRARVGHQTGEKGKIIFADRGVLAVGVAGGSVELLTVQKPGKKPMGVQDFLNGTRGLSGLRILSVDEVFPAEAEENK